MPLIYLDDPEKDSNFEMEFDPFAINADVIIPIPIDDLGFGSNHDLTDDVIKTLELFCEAPELSDELWDDLVWEISNIASSSRSMSDFINELISIGQVYIAGWEKADYEVLANEISQLIYNHLGIFDEYARTEFAVLLEDLKFESEDPEQRATLLIASQSWEDLYALGLDGYLTFQKLHSEWEWERSTSNNLRTVYSETNLINVLENWGIDIKESIIEILGELEANVAVSSLKELLFNDPSWFVRRAAADALWQIGTPEALQAAQEWRDKEAALYVRHH